MQISPFLMRHLRRTKVPKAEKTLSFSMNQI